MTRFDQEMWICDVQSSIRCLGGGSSGGGGNQTTTQTTKADPWAEQQPFLKSGFGRAQTDVLERPRTYFPGSTVVPFAPESEIAMGATTQRAMAGSPLLPAAQNEVMGTLGGNYLMGGNPAYQAMVERSVAPLRREYTDVVMPGIDSAFSMGGRGGSNMARAFAGRSAADAYMRNVGDIGASLAFPTYEAERGRMMNALPLAPSLAAADYGDIDRLAGVGGAREAMSSAELADKLARWNFAQMEPSQRLGEYMGLIGGGYGGQTMTSTVAPRQTGYNPVLGALGMGAMGTGIMGGLFGGTNPLFQKPW